MYEKDICPPGYEPLLSSSEVDQIIDTLAEKIRHWMGALEDRHAPLILSPVLRGGMFIFVDLARRLPPRFEVAYAEARSYRNESQMQAPEIAFRADTIEGRSILLIDEICDTGETLAALTKLLKGRGAADVRSSVLVRRIKPHPTFVPDFVGYEFQGEAWLAGMGLQANGFFRNSRALWKKMGGSNSLSPKEI